MKKGNGDTPFSSSRESSRRLAREQKGVGHLEKGNGHCEKGYGHSGKGVWPSPQNPLNEPFEEHHDEPIECDAAAAAAGSATALPTGAPRRPLTNKRKERNKGVGEQQQQANARKPPRQDRGTYELQIANIIGWECLNSLPEEAVDDLCTVQRCAPDSLRQTLIDIKATWECENKAKAPVAQP
jgi:hypothetical protein